MKRSKACSAFSLVSAIQISCRSLLAFFSYLWASVCDITSFMHPDVQGRVLPYTWRTLQNPIAPSPTAHDGPFSKPLAFRSRRISFQDCSLSRYPHPVPEVLFLCAVAPIINKTQVLSLIGVFRYTPSTHQKIPCFPERSLLRQVLYSSCHLLFRRQTVSQIPGVSAAGELVELQGNR